ncbi:MAG: twin-arginine translocase subunit TatC [Dehalococcoidales bacterium]|jgi:sec-independent protein translocase protein TatC|nr:twin-arginine translocase subunit TatC [Dehalococcoidales bacterium]MDP6825255.1 twin-arginine translocase subunit TatC [Dehalococcoidales bacterium]
MSDDKKFTVLSHLLELRTRLIKCVIAIIITSIIAFIFYDWIFYLLKLPAKDINLIYIEMTEMLGTIMKVCLAAGVTLAMPYLVYHSIMFVSPALTPREKKYVYLILPWVAFMFLGGIIFGYFILVPPATKFLMSFGADIATPEIRVGNYLAVITRLLLAIGFVFEMPVITTFLARLGILKPKWLSDRRRTAIIVAFILAAIITPTFDPINQSLVAIPLIILYEMSIWLAKLVYKKEPVEVTLEP